MKRRDLYPRTLDVVARAETSAKTGEHCPSTGWWVAEPDAAVKDPAFFVRGSLMPASAGQASAWKRVTPGDPLEP